VGDRRSIAASLANLAWSVAREHGDCGQVAGLYRESLALYRTVGDKVGVALALDGLAEVACLQGSSQRAARLYGAAAALRDAIGAPRPPEERLDYEHDVAALRTALGDDAFTAAWAAGRALPLEQAIAEALADANPTQSTEGKV
jgi:hypothetical protein